MVASRRTRCSHSLFFFCLFHLKETYLIKQHNLIICLYWTKQFFHWESIVQLCHLQFWGSAVGTVPGSAVSARPVHLQGLNSAGELLTTTRHPQKLCSVPEDFPSWPARQQWSCGQCLKWHFPVQKQIGAIFTLLVHSSGIRDHLRQIFPSSFFLSSPLSAVSHFLPQSSSPPDPCPWFLIYSS